MKKKPKKKLILDKKTVSNLDESAMNLVRGATLNLPCTQSCSLNDICCPTTQENAMQQILEQVGD